MRSESAKLVAMVSLFASGRVNVWDNDEIHTSQQQAWVDGQLATAGELVRGG